MSPAEVDLPEFVPAPVADVRIAVAGGVTPAAGVTPEGVVTRAAGVTLAVRVRNPAGAAAPVLLVHGLSSNARLWDGVGDELAALGHPVAAVDQRGHGHSDKPDGGYDFATLTGDLVAVLDHLGWSGPVVAAGQSWGGNVVVELAARHPGRVAVLALVDGGTIELSTRFADWPTCEAALTPPPFEGRSAESIERMFRLHHPDWPEAGIAGTLANFEVQPDGTVRPWLSLPHHLLILRQLWEHHPPARWAGIAAPVLLIPAGDPSSRAARFDVAKREEIGRAEAGLPRSVTRWIDGDHDLHAQHPALVAGLLHAAADGRIFSGAERSPT
jgi:pimeloyl-ACP methyl ester carboxylesterase